MRDEDFQVFIEDFGEANSSVAVPDAEISRWQGLLPSRLLKYWREEGWCSYANGLLWTVNPNDYSDVIEAWLTDSPLEGVDNFHVFARSAFGNLYVCGEKCGRCITIGSAIHAISGSPKELEAKTESEKDDSISAFFGSSSPARFDLNDENSKPLFSRAAKKLGALDIDEIYGFEPAIVAGGSMKIENLRKVKLHPHLMMLRQLAAPSMPFADMDINRAFES